MSCERKTKQAKRKSKASQCLSLKLTLTEWGAKNTEQFSYRKDPSVSSRSVWPHNCTTRVLPHHPVTRRWKTSYPFYFYPSHFKPTKYLDTVLNPALSSSLPFPWGDNFLLLFPNLPPVSTYPSWLPGHQQQYLVFSAGQQQRHRQKGTSHPLQPHLGCSTFPETLLPCLSAFARGSSPSVCLPARQLLGSPSKLKNTLCLPRHIRCPGPDRKNQE